MQNKRIHRLDTQHGSFDPLLQTKHPVEPQHCSILLVLLVRWDRMQTLNPTADKAIECSLEMMV